MKTDLQDLVTKLDAAIADSHRTDVKAAMQAMRDDYNSLLQGLDTGNIPSGIAGKVTTDAQQVDHLCTIGSK